VAGWAPTGLLRPGHNDPGDEQHHQRADDGEADLDGEGAGHGAYGALAGSAATYMSLRLSAALLATGSAARLRLRAWGGGRVG
jgi:hypothetical protein